MKVWKMDARQAVIQGLQTINGIDPEYDDGVDADIILSALAAAGFAVVPVEATEEMLPQAWRTVRHHGGQGVDHDCLRGIYRAMIAAATKEQQG